MSAGTGSPWLPILIAAGLLATSVPALGDETTVSIRDEGALLVGEPTDQADVHFRQQLLGQSADVGTAKTYAFPVETSANRLEIDLRYDAGPISVTGPCLKANDLDLYVEGPAWGRAYPGCDGGSLTVLADDVPTGNYTVRVEATQGSTTCVPHDPMQPCTTPGVEYRLEVQVLDVTG